VIRQELCYFFVMVMVMVARSCVISL
jgi:hypothetical protein